jgi:hypothetical protein
MAASKRTSYALFLFRSPPWPEDSDEVVHIGLTSWVLDLTRNDPSGIVSLRWPTSPFRNYLALERNSEDVIFFETVAKLLYEGTGIKY